MFSRISRLFAAALAAFTFSGAAFAQSSIPRFVVGEMPAAMQRDASPRVIRQRQVQVSTTNLAQAAVGGPQVVEIAFFDDAVYNVLIERVEATYSGGVAYVGKVLSAPLNPVIIVDNHDVVSVMLVSDGRRYSLLGTPDRGYTAREMVNADLPDHGPTTLDLTGSSFMPRSLGAQGDAIAPPPAPQADTGASIDVMVAYTPAARLANGGVALMHTNIDAQITLTNAIYTSSNAVQRLRLVYRGEVAYTEVDMDTDLPRAQTGADGHMDELPLLRDLYKADFVSLWGVYNDYCGLGYLMATENANFSENAYSISSSPACTTVGGYTFAHELGHNMGLRHDNFMDGAATTVTPEAGGGAVSIAYAHGHVDLTNRFRTVMSYNDQCVNGGFNCTRIPFFSNPSVSFNNNGSYGPAVLAVTGSAVNAHERQALNDTRTTTANFRTELAVLTGPGIVVMLPSTYTVAEGGTTVALRVARHVGSTGAISVAYTTVNGTATAGADYTLTSGTLNWAAGETADKTINVPITQDSVLEGNEAFTVSITTPTGGASIGSAGGNSTVGTVTITDDEPDTFPVGALLPGGFVSPNVPNANTPNSQWTVDTTRGFQSTLSLQSAQVRSPDDTFSVFGNSDLEYTGVFRAGNVSFRYKHSGYQSAISGFDFQIDGAAPAFANSNGGEVDWTLVTVPITAGTHTLRWRFKNKLPFPCAAVNPPATGGANCADRAWVDSLVLPLARAFDLSGEGRTDVVLQHTDGRQAVWLMNGNAPTATQEMIGAASGWAITGVGDLNGDGKSDLVWKHTDGRVALYLMNGTVPTSTQQILNAGPWSVIHMPDLNGDGKADLVFQNTDGSVAVWTMNGTAMVGGASIIAAGTGWSVAKYGDFDGDGKDDLVWKHTDGRHAIWLMDGVTIKATNQILNAGGWTAMHAADLNGDGRADIVWQHTDGTIANWLMEGPAMATGAGLLAAGSGWSVTRTGDFNGDGKADLFFLHTDGRAAIYLMDGLAPTQTTQILNAGGGWSAARVGDLNGDGKADILWQNADGSTATWLMNGTAMTSGSGLLGAGSGWSIGGMSQ